MEDKIIIGDNSISKSDFRDYLKDVLINEYELYTGTSHLRNDWAIERRNNAKVLERISIVQDILKTLDSNF